ncbi:MAG: arsenosugar biosynthesis radical SAM (seleno)protein ArsS [Burkholderiales bacterium]|nr:arsenosugar biosynthesis radical SAM protein ArsS [Rhodocyclaceae bacterium]MCA3019245.1 arsenosugar biosynthesis radical SAM protein ArsS [Rhodocyclaceae bacterium]MCA3023184.1 arsenosugar biosynthesis radical SAM protein ArsS [Rhodocyclaceae bacterium]MCA3025976.1 arsenosugar biosynthesis radical SAM protein ArsS [Rhodocyclaceae bacterium]MCA3031088.1 arsenosugar biosynthesis radical SAM protein ArsS [Rhodocyclaceae bacterium]
MHQTLHLMKSRGFPHIRRKALDTLQVNLGYKCNQACFHCHVNASPDRTEMMSTETIDDVIAFMQASKVTTLDLTGGAPELNDHFRRLVVAARQTQVRVIDRCNLTILSEPGFEDLAQFLAEQQVEVSASLPCYSQENVDKQRGEGVFDASIAGLNKLNALGYGKPDSGLVLNLVYNPQGAKLPPPQEALEADYHRLLQANFGIVFNHLFTITNMPIQRFGSTLVSKGEFEGYMDLLVANFQQHNLDSVMCRSLLSVDYQGYVYDCDFNQMLGLPLQHGRGLKPHLRDLMAVDLLGNPIVVKDHCYGCTAGQGSSCGGALDNDGETSAALMAAE